MESDFQDRELVWAKMKGFPWWPGIITDNKISQSNEVQYRIDFIGENSHIWTNQASIRKYSNTPSDIYKTTNKKLQKCIEIAEKVHSRELSTNNLFSLNNTFFPNKSKIKLPKKRPPKDINSEPKLSSIEKKLDQSIKSTQNLKAHNKKGFSIAKIEKLQKQLCLFIGKNIQFPSITKVEIVNVFEEFINYEPDKNILQQSFVLKSLKHFKEQFLSSKDPELASLGKLAHKLYLYWRDVAYGEYIDEQTEKVSKITTFKTI
ncbi:hypothetical protein SteCoe_8846 [Stentor coeruleus]|uniref:PWWP domain-containing protein n=1 Tax=Stentor coeruleus TaxID=5963 RepID=A0A1R2CJ42_9CILI|nr:hypothetical protein SteCoe_8846 [Stentor coeruleus]